MNDTYHAALAELRTAQLQFEQADPDHVDIAIMRLQAAELRLRAELEKLRRERVLTVCKKLTKI